MIVAVGRAGLRREPLEELVAQEPQLAAAGKAMAGDLPLTNQLAEVLHVDLQELGGHRRSEDGRELGRARRHYANDNAVGRVTPRCPGPRGGWTR